MKYYYNIEQGTEEWHKIRLGKFTASNFSTLFMKKTTKGYQNLINQIVYERLTNEIPESFSNGWMERGLELEPAAIENYELETFNKVHPVGFVELNPWIGASPDGLIGTDGQVQIKCPKYSTLIEYLLNDKIPNEYYIQMQGELMVTERKWNDFYVYHPNLKPLLIRVHPDLEMFQAINKELIEAISEVQKRIERLNHGI